MLQRSGFIGRIIKPSDLEYSVYIYHHPEDDEARGTLWERRYKTKSMFHALARAKVLTRSDNYRSVEVKCTYHNAEKTAAVDRTVKTFDCKRSQQTERLRAALRRLRRTTR